MMTFTENAIHQQLNKFWHCVPHVHSENKTFVFFHRRLYPINSIRFYSTAYRIYVPLVVWFHNQKPYIAFIPEYHSENCPVNNIFIGSYHGLKWQKAKLSHSGWKNVWCLSGCSIVQYWHCPNHLRLST